MAQTGRRHRLRRPSAGAARPITQHETNTGVSNNKLAIWMFLASEACSSARSSRRTSCTAVATRSS